MPKISPAERRRNLRHAASAASSAAALARAAQRKALARDELLGDGPDRVSLQAHQPDDRPLDVNGIRALTFVGSAPKVRATAPSRVGMGHRDKMAAVSAGWDDDGGAGKTRCPKGTPEPLGYTARVDNPDAKPVAGISRAAWDAFLDGRSWTR